MDIITLDNLSKAIANRIGIDIDEAQRDAGLVLDIFGFDDRVIDNVLDHESRQLFYILEEEGILTTERDVTALYDGREWRTHYWRLRKDKILRYSREEANGKRRYLIDKKQLVSVSDDDIYDTLDENMWTSRKIHSVYT
jgi:hypothetical protein